MSTFQWISDSLQNLVAGLGTTRDKAASTSHVLPVLNEMDLLTAYRSNWFARKIVDIPALDSCRAWRSWQADANQIERIEAEEKRLDLQQKVLLARIKARLWGGSAILIGTSSNAQQLVDPLEPSNLGLNSISYLTVLTPRQLTAGTVERDPGSPRYGLPVYYSISGPDGASLYIHYTRLVFFSGARLPVDDLVMNQGGWGDSVLLSCWTEILQASGTFANIASLVFEAKIDVIKAPNFMENLAQAGYSDKWLKRYGLAATAKGINGTLILDKEEDYQTKTIGFTTLPDIMDRFVQQVAGASDIPATRLLGQSPSGMSATGESDLRNYYDRVNSEQQLEMRPAMSLLDEALIQSALGSRPAEVHYVWSSLWQISSKERTEIGKGIADTIQKMVDSGLYPQEAVAKAGIGAFVEHSVFPGFESAIEDSGGLPDYEELLKEEQERQAATRENLPPKENPDDPLQP